MHSTQRCSFGPYEIYFFLTSAKWVFVATIISSLDSNFCPASDYFKFEKKSHTGPNLESGNSSMGQFSQGSGVSGALPW